MSPEPSHDPWKLNSDTRPMVIDLGLPTLEDPPITLFRGLIRNPLVTSRDPCLQSEDQRLFPIDRVCAPVCVINRLGCLPRKEVIQPHLPVRLPCYDFTPIICPTLDGCLLAVSSPASG